MISMLEASYISLSSQLAVLMLTKVVMAVEAHGVILVAGI